MRARRTLFAIAAGAALQYFLDPERGAARRNRARDQVEPVLRRGQQRVEEARQEQQTPSYDTGYTDRLSTTDTASAGLTDADLTPPRATDPGLATPLSPLDEPLSPLDEPLPPLDEVDDLTVSEVTVAEVTIADPDLGTGLPSTEPYTEPYTEPMETRAGGVPVDDYELADRVRSQVLGRDEFQSAVVNLDAIDGVVTLRGELDATTAADLEQAVRGVDGVVDVISYLHTPGTVAPNEEDVLG